jgi:hypothetical protein
MYGAGSFDKGLSQAREMGQLKAQAGIAKQQFDNYVSEQKKAQKTAATKAKKKTYTDALTYFNDPSVKESIKKDGAYKIANDIKNDPQKQADIKAQGYSVSDYLDAMYNAASDGKFRSQREYGQYTSDVKKQAKSEANGLSYPKTNNNQGDKTVSSKQKQQSLLPPVKSKKQSKKKDESVLTDVKNFFTSKDTNGDGQRDGLLGLADRYILPISQAADEVFLPGNEEMQIKNDKAQNKGKVKNPALKAGLVDRGTETKILHGIGTTLGYTAPYGEGYKGVELGMSLLPKIASKVTNPYVQRAIKGGIAGTLAESGLAAENELVNPDANNAKDYAKRIALGAAGGAIGDPLLHGLGNAAKKGLETASSRTMKNLLPNPNQVQQSLLDSTKAFKGEQALPKQGGVQNPGLLQDLLPKGTNITKPNYLPELTSRTPQLNIPKVGKSINELPPLQEVSLMDRANMLNGSKRTMPDFSFGKQASEPNPPVNVYGAPIPYDKVDHAPADYWRSRYEEFVNYVNKNYDTNNLNKEALDELWTKFARNDEPVNLEQVVDLAYKQQDPVINTADVWNKMGNRPPASKQAQKLLFNDLKLKQPVNPSQQLQDGLNTFRQAEQGPLSLNPSQLPVKPGTAGTIKPLGQNLLPELNINRATQEPTQSLIPQLNRNTPEQGLNPLEQPSRTSQAPSNNLQERGHIETLRNSQNATDSLKERIKGLYKPTTNEEALTIANKYLAQGAEKATSFVKSARVLKPEHIATAHRLIQEFQRTGQIDKAVDIAEHIAEQGTKAGQAVQAFSIFDRLSPEGILVHANRVADRVNAKLSPLQEKVTVTTDTAAQLTDLATTVQKMTQQKTVANDVISLMDKAKAGQKLNDAETKQVRQFVDDAKQWIIDITPKNNQPKAPNKIIKPEIKQQVVSFLDKQEEAARKRLAARKNRALSGLPVDDFYDYAVIGASKLAKGTLNLADFTEQMVREFGQEVAPHVQQIYDKASEMVNSEVKRTVNALSDVQKITNKALKNGKLEETEAENLRKFALSINNLSGDAKIEASQDLQAVLQGLERPSLLQQISATQTIGQLLNPKTLGRNALGNEMFYRLERLNKMVATPIDIARSKITGGERTITFRTNNQGEYWKNWLRGWKAGLKGVNPEGLATQYDLQPNSFNGKWNPLKYMEKALGASLKSFDFAGYKRAVNNTIGELATLRATNEGITGQARKQAIEKYIREADENILSIADQYGKYATFQDNNIIGVGLQKFKRGLNFGKDFGIGDLVIKYPKTPGALLGRALEYSPAGFLKAGYQLAKPILKKSTSTREVTEAFTRALIGSGGAFGIAWFLADKGILTGKGSKDFDVNDLEKSVGKAEYSMNYDALKRWVTSGFNAKAAETQQGDHFISYNWAQPIAMFVAMGTNAEQNAKTSGKKQLASAAWDATNGALDSLVGMSVLQGVQKAFTSYPGQSAGDKLTDIVGTLPASFVPTLSNQIRQKSDNTARSTYDPLKGNVFKNQAKNKIPGVEKSLPPSYDTLGNKKEVYQGKSNTLFNVFLNPAFVSQYNPSPEAKMVLDVINNTGDTSVAPRRAQKYLQIDGKRYDLSPEQYSNYQRKLGLEVRAQLQTLDPNSPSEVLGAQINKILDVAGRRVRTELKAEYGG